MKKTTQMTRLLLIALFSMAALTGLGGTIRISEVMSSNDTALTDEDGDTPDWIELYNTSDSAVDITGWYLSDDPYDQLQWTFPSTTIPAKGFLVVFASDKDRAVSGSELHTNFKLSADGEYIFLTKADGSTTEDSYTISALEKDVSFGYGFSGGSSGSTNLVLTDQGASCKATVPTAAVSSWNTLGFDDSGWTSGTTGVGYDTASDYLSYIGLTVSMQNINPSAYVRVPFSVTDAANVSSLILKMRYDDAFVAYINGTKVAASDNAPTSPAWNSLSAADGRTDSIVLSTLVEYDLTTYASALVEGDNVLAIQAINDKLSSSDLLCVPKLEATISASAGTEIDTSEVGMLLSATPGSANTAIEYQGYLEAPDVFPGRGFYDSAVSVAATNATDGAIIRYTTDGSEPTESSAIFPDYPSTLSISSTANLRVKAFKANWRPSFPRTDTYIFVDDVVTQPQQTSTIYGTAYSSVTEDMQSGASTGGQVIKTGMNSTVVAGSYTDATGQVFTVQDALKAIPSISLTTDDDNLYDEDTGIYVNAGEQGELWERAASAELINPDGSEGFHVNAGLRIRGAASRTEDNPKHSFRLFFRSEYGDGKLNYPLFEDEGVDSFEKIDLRTAQNRNWIQGDTFGGQVKNSFLRDIFGRDASRDMGTTYARSRYYHLYVNGLYWGLYMTEERPEANYGESYFGGDSDDYDTVKVVSRWDTDPTVEERQIRVTDGTLEAYSNLWVKAMAGFSSNADYFDVQGLDASGNLDPTKTKYLDLDNMIDYVMMIAFMDSMDNCISAWAFGVEQDSILNNIYGVFNRNNPDGFKWFQHDMEWSMDSIWSDGADFLGGTGDDNTYYGTTHRDRTGPFNHSNFTEFKWFNPMTLHDKLTANDEYKIAFADRLYKHLERDGALVYSNNIARIEERQAQIDRAIVAHSARWGDYTGTLYTRNTWLGAVQDIKDWLNGRNATLISMYAADGLIPSVARPEFSFYSAEVAAGTTVSITASAGTVYYTTDGSDPRAIGGGIVGSAYSGPITITRPTHLKARAYSGGEWSALTDATYWTPKIPLKITEVMYNAPEGNPADFIEIQNVSSEPVTMKGYKLDNAIEFKFKNGPATLATNEYMVVVDDIDAFSANYDTNGIIIAGEFSGDLSNGGEKVDLEFRNKDMIGFTYNDARDWPQQADGAGHSLVPLDSAMDTQETGSLDYGGNWRASTYIGGSPGYADPAPAATVLLNEITAHTDTGDPAPEDSNDKIELYNPTASAIDISGWYLSDDADDLTQYTIPASTVIPAGGFIVFDEDDFHSDRVIGFGLNKAGEQVYLSSSDRVVDSIRFKGQENGVAYGRYPDGAADWVTTTDTTAGSANQTVDPEIWISELMYNPTQLGNDYEYIKLKNMSSGTIAFGNAIGNYRIDGGVEFDFPDGVSLAAGEELWILSYNPTNTAKVALFCTEYGLTEANETFIGGYGGSLSDSGERISLERPQDSDDPLFPLDISWVVVDEVVYSDQAPWPTSADGGGDPLVRNGLTSWNNVAASVPVTGVTVSPASGSIEQDGSVQLTATVSPVDASNKAVIWSSLNPSIASVDSDGLVNGVSAGSASIVVTTVDGGFAATNVTAVTPIAVTGVVVTPTGTSIDHDGTVQMTATVSPANAANKSVTWSSLHPSIATVNGSGLVSAVSEGTATIRATTVDGGYTDSSSVTVLAPPPEPGNPELEISIENGEVIISITNGTADAYFKVLTNDDLMDPDGWVIVASNLSFDAIGDAVISNSLDGADQVFIKIEEGESTAIIPVTSVSVTPTTSSVEEGDSVQLSAIVSPANADDTSISWSSLNPSIATVNSVGLVIGFSEGTASIVVTTSDGGYTSTNVTTVTPIAVTGVSVSPTSDSIEEGETVQLTATVSPANAANQSITWSSLTPAVATVNSSGLVSGVTAGTATIRVTTVDGSYTADCSITVNVPLPTTATIEAENFDSTGGANEGVQIYTAGAVTGINWFQEGDWVEFENIELSAGTYQVEYTIGAPSANTPVLDLQIDGTTVSSTSLSATSTGDDWDTFVAQTSPHQIEITAGTHTLRIVAAGSGTWNQCNVDKFVLTKVGELP